MAKKRFTAEEYHILNEKKLNKGRQPGFLYDISQLQNDDFVTVRENVSTDELLQALNYKGYLGEMYPIKPCICIVCDLLPFKLLNAKTLWAFEPYCDKYVAYYAYDECTLQYLAKHLHSGRIAIYQNYAITFAKTKLPILCTKWADYKVNNLPKLSQSDIDRIISVDNDLLQNAGYYYQINRFTDNYRLPQAICGILAKSAISINTHIVLERLLQLMSHSSAILDNLNLEQPYRYDFKAFCKDLSFTGRKTKKQNIVIDSFNELVNMNLIDNYKIDNDKLIFTSQFITKHIRQQIKRNVGYYAQIPGSKQAPFIATFIDYLWWIIHCPAHYDKLTISLETLLTKHLGLARLLDEHRNSEIAKVLNTLRNVGLDYNLLEISNNPQDFTSVDVKYLLLHRTKLHTFLQIKSSKEDKEK